MPVPGTRMHSRFSWQWLSRFPGRDLACGEHCGRQEMNETQLGGPIPHKPTTQRFVVRGGPPSRARGVIARIAAPTPQGSVRRRPSLLGIPIVSPHLRELEDHVDLLDATNATVRTVPGRVDTRHV